MHLALHYGMLDNLIDPAEHSCVQPITVAHTTTLGPELDSPGRETAPGCCPPLDQKLAVQSPRSLAANGLGDPRSAHWTSPPDGRSHASRTITGLLAYGTSWSMRIDLSHFS
jgi:hypothetical protein